MITRTRRPKRRRLGSVAVIALTVTLFGASVAGASPGLPSSSGPAPAGSAAGSSAATGWHEGPCTPTDVGAVTLVVDFQDLGGARVTRCATGLSLTATGKQALAAAQIVVTDAQRSPGFACRVLGRPSADEVVPIPGNPNYREACVTTPPAGAYWSYWSARPGGPWTYNTQGYAAKRVTIGGYEGWSFSHNRTPSSNPAPRVSTYPSAVVGIGTVTGAKYRYGNPANGGISYGVGVQVWKNSAGTITHVRGVGRITKLSKATAVQVDRTALGTAVAAVTATTTPVNSGGSSYVAGVSSWVAVSPGTCVAYRTRANFSVRWADTGLSQFSVLSPFAQVCRAVGS